MTTDNLTPSLKVLVFSSLTEVVMVVGLIVAVVMIWVALGSPKFVRGGAF